VVVVGPTKAHLRPEPEVDTATAIVASEAHFHPEEYTTNSMAPAAVGADTELDRHHPKVSASEGFDFKV